MNNNYSGNRSYGGSNRGYSNNYDGNNRYDLNRGNSGNWGSRPKKRTGSKYKMGKNGLPCVTAWRVENGRIMSLIASPAKDLKKGGPNTEKWVAKVQIGHDQPFLQTAFWNEKTRMLSLPDLGLVASTSKDYFGGYGKKRR